MINELGGYGFNVYRKTELTASVTISPDCRTVKYFRYNYWYKQNLMGYEGMFEKICSMILNL